MKTALTLTRDDWLVVNRSLQDRISVLGSKPGINNLCHSEIEHCRRIEKITRAHVDETHEAAA